jgi:hypothetical protein
MEKTHQRKRDIERSGVVQCKTEHDSDEPEVVRLVQARWVEPRKVRVRVDEEHAKLSKERG